MAADLVVIGGGPAGTIAAIAAARQGARVVLVECYGFLGGSLTAAMVAPMMGIIAIGDAWQHEGRVRALQRSFQPLPVTIRHVSFPLAPLV